MGLGHERGATLVARSDHPDAGLTERVEQAKEQFAGHGEGVADAGAAQGVGDEAPDRARPVVDWCLVGWPPRPARCASLAWIDGG